MLDDHRVEYLADLISGMVTDHEIDHHRNIEAFDTSAFLDKVKHYKYTSPLRDEHEPIPESKYADAFNRLNSFRKLDYGFYEMFKPIGGSAEKYIKVKLSASGELDVSGVVGLSDCEHVQWEHGTPEYLRSLNTGNQKYLFKISRPFNDLDSILWWRPDQPEQLDVDAEEEGEIEERTGYRYYKPYETERFLRWFGTNYVPLLDRNSITKKTICSIPTLSDNVDSQNFYSDVTNITSRKIDLSRAELDESTSIPLLSLARKSTIDVVDLLDDEHQGQYLEFVVSGHQQTSNMAFHVTGKMYNIV